MTVLLEFVCLFIFVLRKKKTPTGQAKISAGEGRGRKRECLLFELESPNIWRAQLWSLGEGLGENFSE